MYKYRSIIENPEKLRSMTGLTADEFHALVPIFLADPPITIVRQHAKHMRTVLP